MKQFFFRILPLFLSLALLLPAVPCADAYELGQPWKIDMSELLDNRDNCQYVEMMLDHYLRTDAQVQKTLEEGYCAMFFFEGCSDNIDDPSLADLSFFRVTAICVVLMLDENGEPYVIYFNEHCSTIPDRPLEYGAWYVAGTGDVGPATICDGTYELYSVKHMGDYEALHMRDSYDDGEIAAVYMSPDGYVTTEADCINIHTRTSNHTSGRGMWSAGCMLVGDGNYGQFLEMMDCTYYMIHDFFEADRRVGTVTINRQYLKESLYELYENRDAVDMLLAKSRHMLPEEYFRGCTREEEYKKEKRMRAADEAELMTLPCGNGADARSLLTVIIPEDAELTVHARVRNTDDEIWYEVGYNGLWGYVLGDQIEQIPEENWLASFFRRLFG